MSREDELLARLEAAVSQIERAARDAKAQDVESERRRQQAARDGEMGPDWQRVQRRIDAGETSMEDVFSGRDESPEARRLVGFAQQNLAQLGESLPDDLQEELDEAGRRWEQIQERGR